jgi:hypothetical protein
MKDVPTPQMWLDANILHPSAFILHTNETRRGSRAGPA